MKNPKDALKTLLPEKLEEQGLLPFLKSFWAIFPEPNNSEEYELWEESWSELIDYINLTHFHRFSREDFEDAITEYLNS